MRILLLLMSLVVLAGCSSQTLQPPKYYVLSGTPTSFTKLADMDSKTNIAVHSVTLSDYLQSSNIVLQISDHELFFSANHLWAEPLQVGIEKVLLDQLASTGITVDDPTWQLDLKIDYFHIVDRDAVVLSGSYVIEDQEGKARVRERFSLREPLNDSGYEYAVSVMSSILRTLGQNILAKVPVANSHAL